MTEIIEQIIDNSEKTKELKKINKVFREANDSELKKFIFDEISDVAKYVDNEEVLKLYASKLLEKYIERLISNRIFNLFERYF